MCAQWLQWVVYILWFLAEIAIAATDLAEIIGSATALNLLFNIPLYAGVLITAVDVLVIIAFGMRNFRVLEVCTTATKEAMLPASSAVPSNDLVTAAELSCGSFVLGPGRHADVICWMLLVEYDLWRVCQRCGIFGNL